MRTQGIINIGIELTVGMMHKATAKIMKDILIKLISETLSANKVTKKEKIVRDKAFVVNTIPITALVAPNVSPAKTGVKV